MKSYKKLDPEKVFRALLKQEGITCEVVSEFRFHPIRRWKFDYAIPEKGIALEVEGGVFSGGRHVRGKGFLADCEKYSEAAILGWCVIRVPPSDLCASSTIDSLKRAILLRSAA